MLKINRMINKLQTNRISYKALKLIKQNKSSLSFTLMSASQTQQQKKQRKIFSKTLKAEIKRKPHTEPINGIQYTYGLLQKKSQSSLFNNERFIIIKGHETFGYASKLPDETLLPFLQVKNIPKCKIQILLEKLVISNEKQVLIIQFEQDGKKQKTKWEFICGSKVKAIEWRQKLQGAKNEKIISLKNKAVKVILQDPNQNFQESENEIQKKKKILNGDNNNLQKGQQQNTFSISEKQNKILVRDQDLSDQKRLEVPNDSKVLNQQKENNQKSRQEKFPQVNIFQSLLFSSPNRQVDESSKLDTDPSRQKLVQNSRQKSQQFSNEQQRRSSQQASPNKSREQFLKRKKEDSQLKEELREQNSGPQFLGSLLKTLADKKYQIDKLKKDWGYEFAKGINEFEIVERFKIYVEIIAVKIIDELALESRKRYYKPVSETSQSLKYELQGVSLELFFHQLKEVTSFEKKGSIISNQRAKKAFQQLKNYDYVLRITNNKGRIRVPLAMTVEYKGFVCLAKAIIPEGQSYDSMESLQKQLDLLQAESRINNSIFEDGQNGRIVPLMNKVYDKLARGQNNYSSNNSKKFDICYIQGLKHYLPQDFYRYSTQGNKNAQSINPAHVLRKELIQDQEYDNIVFYGENMAHVIQRLKIPQHFKQAIDNLSEVSSTIPERVNALVAVLQNMDEFITNSHDFSKLVHGYGLNMRYLGLILERAHQTWLKSMVISQIAARCAKAYLQFDLQDCIMNLNETKLENVRRYQIKQVITFMNKILGNSQESDLFWNQLSRQAQENFQCYVNKNQLKIGYFVQALQCQCRIELVNVLDRKQEFFKVPEPLTLNNFAGFNLNSKTYDLQFTQLYTTVGHHLKDVSQESYEQLSILLNLQRKGSLASHFKLNGFDEKIILYMINWLPPSQGKHIYYPEEIKLGEVMPTKTLYQIKLTQIKWLLKQKKQTEAETVKDWIVEHVNKWLGEYHPLLSELYDLLSRYYSTSKNEEKKAVTYCKSSIKNIEKLLGQSNIKLADSYYMLAEIYINYQKKTEGLNCLKRARQILEEREGQEGEAYGIIQLRMGQILLDSNSVKEALAQGIRAYPRLLEADDSEKFVQCLQLIGRCYQLEGTYNDYTRFVDEILSSKKLQILAEQAQPLQRTLKVLVLPYLNVITQNSQTCKQLLIALSLFPSSANPPISVQTQSYSYIKSLIIQPGKVFSQEFLSILQTDLQELLEQVESSGIMTRWKGFENLIQNKALVQKINSISALNAKAYEFLVTLQALAVFMGQGWIEGVLTSL